MPTKRGLLLRQGTLVVATLITAPSSTKNANGKRDPEMTQTKKGGIWHLGMKAHTGVDADPGLAHTMIGTTDEVADMAMFEACLHGEEERTGTDRGYDYPKPREHLAEKGIEDWIAVKKRPGHPLSDWLAPLNHAIACMRARFEYPFRVLKRQFYYAKVRYRGIAKNTAQLATLFALSSLWMARRALMASTGEVCT